MNQCLSFIRNFRPIKGSDGVICNLVDDDLSEVSTNNGVYILVSPRTRFVYPKGSSKVIYIGQTNNIKRRLKEHQKNLRNAIFDNHNEIWHPDRYNYMKYHGGAKVYYYTCKGNQESKELESRIMEMFYDKYMATPIGNGERSFR